MAMGIMVVTPATGFAQTWMVGMRAGGSVERLPAELSQTRFVDGTTLPQTDIEAAFRLRLSGEVSGRPTDRLGLTFGIDTGLFELSDRGVQMDRREVSPQVRDTLLLGRVFAELQLGRNGVVALKAGRYRPQIGAGTVFDAYAFGAQVDVDLSLLALAPLSFKAQVLLPDGTFTALRKTSPLIDFQVEYRLGWFSRIKGVASIFIDTNSELADPVRSAMFKGSNAGLNDIVDGLVQLLNVSEDVAAASLLDWIDTNIEVQTKGPVVWTGLMAELGDQQYSIQLTALGAFGALKLKTRPTQARIEQFENQALSPRLQASFADRFNAAATVPIAAFFGEITTRLAVGEHLQLGTFALALSGDEGIRLADNPQIGSFLGLSPLLPRTAVFFGGTFGPDQATPTAFSLAPDASGILAAGAHSTALWRQLTLRLDVAAMSSLVPSRFTGGRFYGVEIDFSGTLSVVDDWALFIDGGILWPGDFFDDEMPAVQFVAGIQIFTESR
ncbi:MAG: hypothetical protein AAFN74_16680 [Myxococcota bacterium]